ncbi:hypothetical protein [Desulfobacca acetoxidans]
MAINPKVGAVIAAAVQAYIQDEEAWLASQAAAPVMVAAPVPSTTHNIWGLAGRQHGMQMRYLIQRRSLT